MDMQRLSQALKAAHAAGDTAAATKLAQEIRRLQQQSNPDGTGIGRAIKRGAVQTAAAPFTLAATADVRALGDIGKSEDAIRYDEAIRAGVPTQAFASRAANISDPRQVNSMMQQYGVSPAANVNYQQVVDKRLERKEDAAKNPEEYLKRLSENSATAGRLFKLADSFARSPTADAYAKSLAEAPDGFKGWLSTVTDDPLGFMAFMGETIAESAPQIGAGVATSVVTGSPVAGATVMSLGGLSREYANEVNSFLKENGIDLADPESAKKLFSSPELMDKANERGVTRGLVIAAADFAGQGLVAQQIIRKSLKRQAVAQGGSEGAGEALATKAVGDAFSFKETITEALAGTGSTIGEAAVAKTLFNKDGKLASSDDLSTLPISEKLAAADVARMLDEISKANGYKLKNVDPSSNRGAKQTLEDARSTNVQAINDLKKVLKKQLDPKNASSLEELLSVYSESAAGIGAGKKKVSQKVTVSQLQALEGLVGDTKEGQQLLQELLKSNVITDLFKDGMKGGVSQFTDMFDPRSHSGAVYDPSRYANLFVGGGAALATKGATLVIPAGGLVVDFFTGRRSKVARFVKNNKKDLGLPAPEGTSVIEEKQKQKADAKDRRAAIAQIATILDAPKPGFVENILLGTGLDRSGLETVLNNMASDFGSNPDFVSLLNDIQKNLDGEGVAYLDNLSEIIPVIGAYAQKYNPDLVTNTPDNPLLKRSFDGPNVQTDMPNMGGGGSQSGPQFTTPENYNRGIQDNLDFVRTLQEGAGKDKKISRVDRGRLITSLENLTNNLGSNPVETVQTEVQKLQDQGVNQDAIDTYVKPYVDRVIRQQRPKGLGAAVDAGVAPDVDTTKLTDEQIAADAEALGKRLTEIFNKNKKPRLSMEPFENQPTVPELWTTPPQAYDSAATSINKNKNPAGYTKLKKQGVFKEGQTVVDIGGGRFDNVVDELAKEGVTVKIYDPFNRTPEHNAQVASEVADGKADVAVSNNTLNVIQEPENINRVIRQAHNAIPTGAKAYFTVYEGARDSVGKETTQGYQRNEPVTSYIPRLEQVFGKGNVERKGDLLIATKQDAPVRLNQQPPILQQPEIPRGETTNIQMPNTLGSAFEFAKNSNFRKGRDFKLALQEKALEAQDKEGIDLSELSEENSNRLADYVVADALEALKSNANAIGWYDRTVTDALNTLGEVYPEILTNPTNKLQFIWALAVTSNGTKVDKNFELAATAYDTLQKTGRFPTDIGIGEAAKAINSGLAQYHTMMDKFARKTNSDEGDHQLLADFMNSQVPVKQIEKEYDVKISGEGKNTLVRGASILGPKIGNGFFSNLYGNFDALTMDRWLMRTVGRHRGTLVKINQPMVKQKTSEIKTMLKDASPETMKGLRSIFKPYGTKVGKNLNTEQVYQLAARIAKESTSQPWRQSLNDVSEDLRKAGNALAKYLDGQVEAPAGARERDFIRSVFGKALDRLNIEPAVTQASNTGLTMSDLQALLWYPEKRLYDSSKAPEGEQSRGYADDEAPDYANAARKLVEARKGSLSGGRLGSARAAGDGGRGAISPNARLSQQPTGSAGILFRNASQSAASRRPRSDDRNIVPNTSEVKQAAKPVKALIEIGSPDGQFPDGIKDIEGVRRLAEATNTTIDMYINQDDMIRRMGFDPNEVRALGGYNDGIAYVLAEGSDRKTESGDTIGFISKFDEYITTLHEVFHGVNDQLYNPEVLANMDSEARARMEGRIAQGRDMGTNKVTGRKEIVSTGSFDAFIAGLTTGKTKVPNNIRKKMLAEMLDLQKNGYFRSQSGSVAPIRDKRAMETNPDFKRYVRNAPETAVDVIMYYAHDPKRMKREYPNLAKMVKGFFSQSSKVQFFSHPLAMAIAVVYAMLLKQEQADEEDRQMPPGALSPQQQMMAPGALTA